jgi:hypothetical protein
MRALQLGHLVTLSRIKPARIRLARIKLDLVTLGRLGLSRLRWFRPSRRRLGRLRQRKS